MSLEGFDPNGHYWFTGGTSFMSNNYVIYKNGLDGYEPNPYAIKQGGTYVFRMFDKRSIDKRSSYYQFITYISDIANRAAANEEAYLNMKLNQLRQSKIDSKWLDKIEMAIKQKDYSSAYTLLLRRDKDLQKFRQEINSNRNKTFAKTNEFFNSQFYKFISEKFQQQLSRQDGLERSIELDNDFEKIIDEFFMTKFDISIDDNMSLKFIRDQFIQGLQRLAEANNGRIYYSAVLDRVGGKGNLAQHGAKIYDKNAILTKKGKFRSPRVLADKIAHDLMAGIAQGLGQEVYVVSAGQGIGARAINTGNVLKEIEKASGGTAKVAGKTDAIYYECASGTAKVDKIIQSLYENGYNYQMKSFYDEVDYQLGEAAKLTTDDFFKIAVNVKGYMSNYDLQIEGEGSFTQRVQNLQKVNLDGNMTDKLIFMLNNTTKGCIADGRQGEIEDYLASVCVAWMWDNSEDIFDLKGDGPSNFKKIYLFNSGGAFFTASQILQQTLERLVNYGEDTNKFVRVTIKSPKPYGGYSNLIATHPTDGISSWEEWQAMLQDMWETVKTNAMATGSISIHFNQSELNELLGNLKAILNSK